MNAKQSMPAAPQPSTATCDASEGQIQVFPDLDRSWPADGIGPVRTILVQLPDPATLPSGSTVLLHAAAPAKSGAMNRWLSRPRQAHLAVRCTALLARGYANIRVERDEATREWLALGTVVRSATDT